jgi:hypothetical protein
MRRMWDMATNAENAAIARLWFTAVWTGSGSLVEIDQLASPRVIFQYSPNSALHGVMEVRIFAHKMRNAFPDIAFEMIGEPRAKEESVVYDWRGAGTHTGPAFCDFLIEPLAEASGERVEFSGFTVIKLADGKIVEESIWSKERQAKLARAGGKWHL